MRHRFLISTLLAAAAVATLPACSSFRVGAACYVPWGVQGTCQVTMGEPAAPADATAVAR